MMDDLYAAALRFRDSARGFYNENVRVETSDGPVIVRIPIAGAETMDLRIWPEQEVLAALESHVDRAPRLLHASRDPAFQVHEFIDGDLVDDVAPRGRPVPPALLTDVVQLFVQLTGVPLEELPQLPPYWPTDTDTAGFARLLSGITQRVHTTFLEQYRSLFSALGIPDDPITSILTRWSDLGPRPFGLIHSDVHRKNMIFSDGHVVFLDWELALWGDPVYDLAVHIHKMGYQDDERQAVLDDWVDAMPPRHSRGWEHDLGIYLAHERAKSAIVDTVRYAQLITSGSLSHPAEQHLFGKLADKLNAAGKVWQRREPITTVQVETFIRDACTKEA